MLYLVFGNDEFLREEFVGHLKARMRELPVGEHNVDDLGHDTSIGDVISACSTAPFLCEKRLVVARGIASEATRTSRSKASRVQPPVTDALSELVAYLPHLPSTTHLVLVEEDARPIGPLIAARPDAIKREYTRPREDALPTWVSQRARKQGVRISSAAAKELAELVGADLRALTSEIAKLGAYAEPGDTIDVQHVRMLVSGSGPSVFALHDAVAERRPGAALAATRAMLNRGMDPVELLAQVAGLVRRLLIVKELVAQRRPLTREAPTFGLSGSRYLLDKLQRQVAHRSVGELERAYVFLRDTDVAIKTGRLDPDLAVELAVAALTDLVPIPSHSQT